MVQDITNDADDIVDADPTHVLPAAADFAAQDRAIKGLAQFGVVKTVGEPLNDNLGANSRLAGNQRFSAAQRVY